MSTEQETELLSFKFELTTTTMSPQGEIVTKHVEKVTYSTVGMIEYLKAVVADAEAPDDEDADE